MRKVSRASCIVAEQAMKCGLGPETDELVSVHPLLLLRCLEEVEGLPGSPSPLHNGNLDLDLSIKTSPSPAPTCQGQNGLCCKVDK